MAALVTACGGGGSNTSVTPSKTTFAGTVIDGYIEGATVCLDLNANLQCDSDEPKDTTKADGTYLLEVTGVALDKLKDAQLVTVVPDTAKDADDGGKTLAEAGKSGFSLMAPASAYLKADGGSVTGAVISPLTTLVAHDIITSQSTLAKAQANVRARLGMAAEADLNQDFVAKNDAPLRETAQMLTVALGNVKAEALKVTGTTDKEALLTAVQYLQTQFTELKAAFDDAKKADPTATPVARVKTAQANGAAKPKVQDLLDETKKITSSTASSALALIEQGFYGADHVLDICNREGQSNFDCTPNYWTVQGSGGKLVEEDYVLDGAAWKQGDVADFVLTSKGWVKEDDCAQGQSSIYSADSSGVTTVTFCAGTTGRITARTVDAAGKTLSALGLNPPKGFESTTMPAGSQLYWLDFAYSDDQYFLWTDSPVQSWSSASTQPKTFVSIADYIAEYTTSSSSGITVYTGWDGLNYSFNTGGTATGGTVSLWNHQGSTPAAFIGQAKYSIRTVHGQQLLVIEAPTKYPDELVMFAVKDGALYGGVFQFAAVKSLPEAHFNKTMMDAILKAGNKPAVLN